jgi:hypothetical protein
MPLQKKLDIQMFGEHTMRSFKKRLSLRMQLP